MSLENLKLSKQLVSAMLDAGYHTPKDIQAKTISRILGGQNIIGVGPEGCGKTTAYIISVLMKLKGPINGGPRALILVPNKEQVTAVTDKFKWLGKETGIRTVCLTSGLIGEQHLEAIEDGLADIIIGTPDKINALYVKSLLNLRSLNILVVDDAEIIVRLNFHAMVYQIAEGLSKSQRLIFTTVINEKVDRLVDEITTKVELFETSEKEELNPATIPLILYKVSNFKTKLNLLELMLRDSKVFTKVVVFVNTRQTAETLYSSLKKRLGKCIGIINYLSFNSGLGSVEAFKQSTTDRILVLCNEDQPSFNLLDIPYIFHMEYPEDDKAFIDRVKLIPKNNEAVAITFATNLELDLIKKTEKRTGKSMQLKPLPDELLINNISKIDIEEEMPGVSGNNSEIKNTSEDWDWKIK